MKTNLQVPKRDKLIFSVLYYMLHLLYREFDRKKEPKKRWKQTPKDGRNKLLKDSHFPNKQQ